MDDDELEELRRRKMAELQQNARADQEQSAVREAVAREQFEAQKAAILRAILEPEARERLTRVRLARPDVAESLESQLVTLYQQGRIRGKINDQLMREFLARVTPRSREINIDRR